ncbi:MAG: lipoprotein [Gammaproteobacteria bacterium]|nr:lipoprotein [Gammaproteobacteria bacterium]
MRTVVLLTLLFALTGCGVKGDLYIEPTKASE